MSSQFLCCSCVVKLMKFWTTLHSALLVYQYLRKLNEGFFQKPKQRERHCRSHWRQRSFTIVSKHIAFLLITSIEILLHQHYSPNASTFDGFWLTRIFAEDAEPISLNYNLKNKFYNE